MELAFAGLQHDSIFTHPSSSEAIGEVLGARRSVASRRAAYVLALS
jgi:hypothetical protein